MQQAILALHWLLQDVHGLIENLTQAGSDSKQALQCIYALCDGTEQSVANVPDVQMFASNGTGTVNDSFVFQHVQLQLVHQISKPFSTQETAHACKAECECIVMPAVPMSAVPMSAVPTSAVPMSAVPMSAVPMPAFPMSAVPCSVCAE